MGIQWEYHWTGKHQMAIQLENTGYFLIFSQSNVKPYDTNCIVVTSRWWLVKIINLKWLYFSFFSLVKY